MTKKLIHLPILGSLFEVSNNNNNHLWMIKTGLDMHPLRRRYQDI